jgi:glycosyltransferase involved in cell wall biosynthesis
VNAETSLAEKLNELIAEPPKRESMRKAALERARDSYSWEKVTDEYEKILGSLVGVKSRL